MPRIQVNFISKDCRSGEVPAFFREDSPGLASYRPDFLAGMQLALAQARTSCPIKQYATSEFDIGPAL
jgi:hypothetical protein